MNGAPLGSVRLSEDVAAFPSIWPVNSDDFTSFVLPNISGISGTWFTTQNSSRNPVYIAGGVFSNLNFLALGSFGVSGGLSSATQDELIAQAGSDTFVAAYKMTVNNLK